MINKFIVELESELESHNIEDREIVASYKALYDKYIRLGQSEFNIILHFGEPSEIVERYIKTSTIDLPDMDSEVDEEMPKYLTHKDEVVKAEEKRPNIAPTTKAGLILNDIFFVGLGLLLAIAGCIAIGGVSIFMTAGSVWQMVKVWELAEVGQRVGGFFLALLALAMSVLFYFIIVWIVKVVVKYMKQYIPDHKENWAKCE